MTSGGSKKTSAPVFNVTNYDDDIGRTLAPSVMTRVRYSKGILTPYAEVYPSFSVVPLLILSLRISLAP